MEVFMSNSLEQQLKDIERQINEIINNGMHLEKLFTSIFMRKNTKFNNILDFFKSGGFIFKTEADFNAIDIKQLDDYICKNTKFKSWDDMGGAAAVIYTQSIFE